MKVKSGHAVRLSQAAAGPSYKPPRRQQPVIAPVAKPDSFFYYLWKNKSNRNLLTAGLAINLVLFLVYKYYYPLPDLTSDSQGYIHAASANIKVFYRPFGYARFLQVVHYFAEGHYPAVFAQYFSAVLSSLFCFCSVDYLFGFRSKGIRLASWLLLMVNPCTLVLSNTMLSDTLFISLSVAWFSLLLWSLKRGQWWSLIMQLIVLYWSFQVRYNALYYPLIAAVIFLFTPGMKMPYRFTGLLSSFVLIFATYNGIKNETYTATGTSVFAGFSGWQMANNALLIYKHANVKPEIFDDPDQQLLDKFVRHYIDSIPATDQAIIQAGTPSSVFLWDPGSPLKRFAWYTSMKYKQTYFTSWYSLAPLYNDYGTQIIRHYPGAYFRYYLLPNLGLYFIPPAEVMEQYDKSGVKLSEETRKWLHVKKERLSTIAPALQRRLMYPYPVLHAVLLVFCLVVPLLYLWKFRKQLRTLRSNILLPVLFWYLFLLMDMAFSTAASIMALRYGAMLFITGFSLPFYFLDQLVGKMKTTS